MPGYVYLSRRRPGQDTERPRPAGEHRRTPPFDRLNRPVYLIRMTRPGPVRYIRADVSIEDDVQALVDGTVKIFGKLDVAVNNAGLTGSRGPLATQTLEAYNAVFDTNVRGVFFCLKHELRVMTGQGFGCGERLHPVRRVRGGRPGHPRQRRRAPGPGPRRLGDRNRPADRSG